MNTPLWKGDEFFEALERSGGDPWEHGFSPQCVDTVLGNLPDDINAAFSRGFPRGDGPLLVYVGAFDLWHKGHSSAVAAAVSAVNHSRLMLPSGVLVVPDNDRYVADKRPENHSGLAKRCLHISMDQSLKELPCPVHITRLAGAFHTAAPNFTHVLSAVRNLFYWRGIREVGLVVGQDNASFSDAVSAIPGFFTVVVQRGDTPPVSDDPKVIVAEVTDPDVRMESSTRARYRSESTRSRGGAGSVSHVRIKDDADMLPDATRTRLLKAVKDFYTDRLGVRVTTFKPSDDPPFVLAGKTTVSLDRYVAADLYLPVSRVFADDGVQESPVARFVDDVEWSVDPDTVYHLVDDDMDTGGNMQTARDWIVRRGGTVDGFTTKTLLGYGEDTVDLSDFSCVEGTGLLVKDSEGNLVRVPYLPPRINLMNRASIPDECSDDFHRTVLEALTPPET